MPLFCKKHNPPVGASLLAMIVNDDAGNLKKRVALKSFASKLAPTRLRATFREYEIFPPTTLYT
ncbi:hypothetical protein CRX42_19565 [Pseudomonas jessenii]|jgi:hypothetical protein|uniref:Uncharacterized protein n=1 Tax=Pseudomonas jessenii TaxID=77298 RepID=A0A2W0EK08_PSEJE|nr:hypothetical protein CRX42_19565 [Pseudomonas jessenii]